MIGWCDSPGLGVLHDLDDSRARAYRACSSCGWGCLDIFTLTYLFSPLFPSLTLIYLSSSLSPYLWEKARYRLKYYLKGPLNPQQNKSHLSYLFYFFIPLSGVRFGTAWRAVIPQTIKQCTSYDIYLLNFDLLFAICQMDINTGTSIWQIVYIVIPKEHSDKGLHIALFCCCVLTCCFTSTVKSYCHVGTVSQTNHTFPGQP